MKTRPFVPSALVLVLLVLSSGVALAHGARGVTVSPLTARADQTVTVEGELLGPNSRVEVRILGGGVDESLGEAKADEEGDFTREFRLPPDLEPGNYQIEAKGKESATTQITVSGGPTGTETEAGKGADAMKTEPEIARRPPGQAVLLVAIFGALAAAGLYLATTATRHKGGEAH